MLRAAIVFIFVFPNLPSVNLFAAEFAGIRAFQEGPVGDGPGFAYIRGFEGELAVGVEQKDGTVGIEDDDVSSSHNNLMVKAGLGFSFTKALKMTLFSDLGVRDYEESVNASTSSSMTSDFTTWEGGANMIYHAKPFFFGGGFSVQVFGTENRVFTYLDDEYKQTVNAAAMPILRAFVGIKTKTIAAGLRVKSLGKGESAVEAFSPTNEKYTYDINRRSPMEISFDGRIKLTKMVELGAGITSVAAKQASEMQDEWSIEYVVVDGKRRRNVGKKLRNRDYVILSVGSRLKFARVFHLLAGITFETPSYSTASLASPEHKNLGGLTLNVGPTLNLSKSFRAFFHGSYQLASEANYTPTSDDRSEIYVDRTQRQPIEKGEKVAISQSGFSALAGINFAL